MRYKLAVAALILFSTGFYSCNKMLDVPSKRAVTGQNMFHQKNDAQSAVSACYALLRAALMNENAYWVYGDLRAGDFQATSRGDLKAVVSNDLTANYTTMDDWRDWRRFYAAIAQCNITIAHLPDVVKNDYRYSVNDMSLDMAQARVIRAFLYYYIVRVWGDVPLVMQPADGTFKPVGRTDWHQVLDTAAQDVLNAVNALPWSFNGQSAGGAGSYPGEDFSYIQYLSITEGGIAVTRGIGYTLLAHIYDWKGDYANALYYANMVFNNQGLTHYNLVSTNDLTRVDGTFRGRGLSNIFQVDMNFDHAEYSTTGQLEDWTLRAPDIPKTQSEIYVPKDSILNIYNDPNDERPKYFFAQMNDIYPEFYKMKQLNSAVKNPTLRFYASAIVVFRYEELYLLRAECEARLNMGGAAVNDLNTVRALRKLGNVDASVSGQELLDNILDERRRELIGEGWRWFDLVHFGKVPQFTRFSQADVDNGAAYWPISKAALSENSDLIQNSYWK